MGKKTTKTTWSNTILQFANNLLCAYIVGEKYVICPVFGTKHELVHEFASNGGFTEMRRKHVLYHGHVYFVQSVSRAGMGGQYFSAGIVFKRPNYAVDRRIPIMMVSEDFSEQMFFDTNGVPSAENKNQTG